MFESVYQVFLDDRVCALDSVFEKCDKVWEKYEEKGSTDGFQIHCPNVPAFSPLLVDEMMRSTVVPQCVKSDLRFMFDPKLFPQCVFQPVKRRSAKIDGRLWEKVIESGVFERASPPTNNYFSSVFLIPEREKNRFRLIQNTVTANVLCREATKVNYEKIHAITKTVLYNRWAIEFDFKAWYYQFHLAEGVRDFFCTVVNGEYFRPTRIPMGFKNAVLIAHSTLCFLCHDLFAGVRVFPYIDNLLIVGNERENVEGAAKEFVRRCLFYNVTIGTQSNVSQKVIFRGVALDFKTKTVRMKEVFVEKVKKRRALTAERISYGEFRSIFSMFIYASITLQFPLSNFFYSFKFLLRHQNKAPEAEVTPWAAVAREWEKVVWIGEERKVRPFTFRAGLITDASMEKMGAILILGNTPLFLSFPVPSANLNIMHFEALAIVRAIKLGLAKGWIRERTEIDLYCDNQAVLFAVSNTRSRNFLLNRVVGDLLKICEKKMITLRLNYVNTEENAADPLSRNQSSFSEAQRAFVFDHCGVVLPARL